MTSIRRTASVFCLFLMTMAFSAQAAELVVVASSAPTLKLGQVVNSDTPLDIPDGASVTVVSSSGKTVTLKGPHAGPAGIGGDKSGDTRLIASLSNLIAGSGKETTSLGVIRSVAPPAPPTDPWVINIGDSDDHCVPAKGPAKLWRANGKKARVLMLKNLSDKTKATADWPAGTHTLIWPSRVTLSDGVQYLVRLKNSNTARKLIVHLVPDDFPSGAHRVAWMADKGCQKQAKRLLARLR